MAAKKGEDCILYRNTGTYESPVWAEMENVVNLTMARGKGEADVSRRATAGEKVVVGVQKERSIDFDYLARTGADAHFDALNDSYEDGDAVEVAVMDGDIEDAGTRGLRATCEVMKLDRGEQLTDAVRYSCTLKPTDSDNPPEWITVE